MDIGREATGKIKFCQKMSPMDFLSYAVFRVMDGQWGESQQRGHHKNLPQEENNSCAKFHGDRRNICAALVVSKVGRVQVTVRRPGMSAQVEEKSSASLSGEA